MASITRAPTVAALSMLAACTPAPPCPEVEGGEVEVAAGYTNDYGEVTLDINPASIYTGALGGATFAWRAVVEEGKTVEART